MLSADLLGEGLAVEPMALALALDRSGSMDESSGAMSKIERLRSSCQLLIDLISPNGLDELAIVPFSTAATVDLSRSALSPTTVAAARNAVASLTPGGLTSIGGGLRAATGELATTILTRKNVIVVTDGIENTAPAIADVPPPSGTRIYSVGVGLPEFIDVGKLQALATGNGGYFQITDASYSLLPKFFIQIFSDLVGQQLIVDPTFDIQPGQTHDVSLDLSSGEHDLTAVLTWEDPASDFAIELITPERRRAGRRPVRLDSARRPPPRSLAAATIGGTLGDQDYAPGGRRRRGKLRPQRCSRLRPPLPVGPHRPAQRLPTRPSANSRPLLRV